jgi:uncharacterized membrane protein YcaP (DUF421 family)
MPHDPWARIWRARIRMGEWFELTMSPLELFARGTIIYLGLLLTLRFLLRRDVGSMSVADLLFIVLIADAAQNAMAGEYRSITDGLVLLATLVGWNVAIDWAAYHSPRFRRLVEPPAVPLIRDGKWMRANLRKEWITTEEVTSKLREHGIEDVRQVRLAYLESSGELGVIRFDRKDVDPRPKAHQHGAT